MNERRRATLDGGRSELSAAEGGTTSGRRPMRLLLGEREYDLTTKALVMGIVNRTPDSFFDKGRYFDMDESLKLADQLVADGADIIDVGGVKAGPGPEVGE